MPATVTLSTTTLAATIERDTRMVKIASTSGILPGTRLVIPGPDREVMTVLSLGPDPWVIVQRGMDGTVASQHVGGITVYIARGDQLYSTDPVGRPAEAIPVSPWINVRNGKVWFAQGDTLPIGQGDRWWQEQETTREAGALGVRVTTSTPTAST